MRLVRGQLPGPSNLYIHARRKIAWAGSPASLFMATALLIGCATRPQTAQLPTTDPGAAQFESYCAACHQYDGQGMGDAPPLDGSPFVSGPPERLVKIVLHGVRGSMVIAGRTYNREMPGFKQMLTDDDAAALVSFVRDRFGSGASPVTMSIVARVRSENANRRDYWTAEELLADQ